MSSSRDASIIDAAELDVARAVARRAGRTIYAVRADASAGRQLVFAPPDDGAELAYAVDARGQVRFGPAGRVLPPADGAALVHDPSEVPAEQLAAVREFALTMGRTVFVAVEASDPSASTLRFEPPLDGSLRYAVRVDGELLLGDDAIDERPARVTDRSYVARTSGALRQLRRLRQRADELAGVPQVTHAEWMRVERLIPDAERRALRASSRAGLGGGELAELLHRAADRELERLRDEAMRLLEAE
jgi:hypothetical protein